MGPTHLHGVVTELRLQHTTAIGQGVDLPQSPCNVRRWEAVGLMSLPSGGTTPTITTIASACRMRICLQVAKHSRNKKAHHLLDSGLF
jgi:hypothetical protein